MGFQTKTNHDSLERVLLRLDPVRFICLTFWLLFVPFMSIVIGQNNKFGLGFTTLNRKPACLFISVPIFHSTLDTFLDIPIFIIKQLSPERISN